MRRKFRRAGRTGKMTKPESEKNTGAVEPETGKPEAAQGWTEVPPPEPAKPEDPAEALKKEIAELKDKLLYLTADYQNYRKRTGKDLAEARMLGIISAVDPFLRVNDFLAMARQSADRASDVESLKQGLLLIIKEYEKAMEELGVKKFAAIGEKFDPELHDAVAHEPSDTVPEGHVSKEWTGGYKLGERLLRPARVVVSAGPAPEKNKEA